MAILRKKKIRGLRRRKQLIINWYNQNKKIDLNLLRGYGYFYAKAKVGPWANLDNEIQDPSWYRKLIFNYLLELFSNWKIQLDQLEQPYYLKIWLYNPRFLNSQVVAAIGDRIEHYELLFTKAKQQKEFSKTKFSCNLPLVNNLDWELYKDEDYIPESDFANIALKDYKNFPEEFYKWQRFYRELLKLNTPTTTVNTTDGQEVKAFVLKKGDPWIGQNKQ